ncbi:MAG: hypothetical protein IPN69_08645 [Acidobacteria bacterium]|nr:hypothetical protein [Acidobacteriota bacterium]
MIDYQNVKKAAKMLRESMHMLGRGPLEFYLLELVAAHDLLMERFSPFKVGDRVRLTKTPDYSQAPGWSHCSHFLIVGSEGTIQTASCGSRGFKFGVIFDDESWIDTIGHARKKGTVVPIEDRNKHAFQFGEDSIEHYICAQ